VNRKKLIKTKTNKGNPKLCHGEYYYLQKKELQKETMVKRARNAKEQPPKKMLKVSGEYQ